MARVTTVQKARKPQGQCGRCRKEIKAGDPYCHAAPGFRSRKQVRCTAFGCRFRPSDLTNSKLSQVLSVAESIEDRLPNIDLSGGPDGIEQEARDLVQEFQDALEEVRDEYQDALDQWEYGNDQLQERVDECDGWYYEAEGFEPPCYEGPDEPDEYEEIDEEEEIDEDEESYEEALASYRDDVIDAVQDLLSEVG